MFGYRPCWRMPALGGLVVGLSVFCTQEASAHVKWFCAFNVAGQPQGLENVLCPDFELLMATAIFMLLCGYLIEGSFIGAALLAALNRVTSGLRANTDVLMRAVCGFFFVALWTKGGIILTPELTTASPIVPWVQLAIAACLIWRQTLPLAGLGIAALFGLAMYEYGLFHLMDYPIFLGVAVYFMSTGLQRDLFGARPVDILRWSAAITLMWASVEKWAYPQWSFPLFITHPGLGMGFTPDFFLRAAGMVEFTLSFALLLTPLVRRASALVLCGMFVSAVLEFGKIDAIGHSAIVAVLLAIIGDDFAGARLTSASWGLKSKLERFHLTLSKWDLVVVPACYCATLAGFLVIYYVLHAVLFGTSIA